MRMRHLTLVVLLALFVLAGEVYQDNGPSLGPRILAAQQPPAAPPAPLPNKAGSFKFGDEFFAWRDWKIDIKRLKDRRRCVISFGSCSFDEPREDLRALKLL